MWNKKLTRKAKMDFMAIARTVPAPNNTKHYTLTCEKFNEQYPGQDHPSNECFRRHCKAEQIPYPYKPGASESTLPEPAAEPASVSAIHADVDLTPADGLIRKYRAFLRLYRNSTDQAELDHLLDATCPEIWED